MSQRIHHGPVSDPAAALAAVASAMGRLGVAVDERSGLLATVARALKEHQPGGWITVGVGEDASLTVTVGGGGGPDLTATAPIPVEGGAARDDDGRGDDPHTDESGLLDLIIEQHDTLGWHRQELEQTNQGVLALHAELAETTERLRHASDLQRRLLSAERAAHAAAEASRARLAFLAHAGATLAESLDHEQILSRLHAIVVPRYASAMVVWLVRDPGVLGPFPAGDGRPPPLVEKAYASGRAQHATRLPGGEEVVPGVDTTLDEQQILAIPLISRGSTIGVLAAEPPADSFTTEDVAVFTELARLTAAATDNALRYEHERGVAQLLQRAMLTDLPASGRVQFTARYLPAEAGLNVGGDWYDAFERPDGDIIAAVGDVTGHGLQAAALMGQLRTTLRAYAIDADGPGEVLTRMHRLLSHLQPEDLATAVLAQLHHDGVLRWANAGHPPPLLRAPDGTVTVLEGHDFLLGMPLEGASLEEFSIRPEPGSIVLFYTDGLIERRGLPLGDGIDRLVKAFGRARGELDAMADSVLAEMLRDSAREDDTCLLMFRRARP
ncbi:GAF domain-containing SpoIIE family protein phosphatase [Actinomadura sp. DC4]|uniref:PP2C family protein-serine/threonine phosphatase n=1 Tax=Actinomadura sp. DC4 TaxID=3055069 RepID=UPI0025AF9DE4|nr:GAF domain-containing SpoIIE family protein phosphatase [Actinomadura sp. DC4]MDN3358253.1 SpoIIE family protein phosphatase [Actinomadura sp. DC4]